MTELPANLVIRRVAPRRTLLLVIVGVIGGLIALGAAYEIGRYDGGYDVIAAARQRAQLEATTSRLGKDNTALRKQVTDLETMRVGLTQERTELAHNIGDLQSQVASQAQQRAFYRGVVSHGVSQDDLAMGLKIQQLSITADSDPVTESGASAGSGASPAPSAAADRPGPSSGAGTAGAAASAAGTAASATAPAGARDPTGHFQVHLTLLQTASPQAAVSGTFQLSVEGRMQGKAETLDLAALTGGKLSVQSFSFRYYQSLEQEVALPSGFSPERLTVEVREGGKPVTPLIQTFPWKVDAP